MNGEAVGACAEQAWIECQLARPVASPAWHVWTYDEPAIVLGCSQRRLLAEVGAHRGLKLVLRRAGGGAVLVGPWMLGVSAVLPIGHALVSPNVIASYRWMGELLGQILRDHGFDALALPPENVRALPPVVGLEWACFGRLSPWEVIAGGRKIAGLAQVRSRYGVLLVGGLLLSEPDWSLLCAALNRPASDAASLRLGTTSCTGQGGGTVPAAALAKTLTARLGAVLSEVPLAR
jgi:lipoate-protein ligase A